MNLLLLAPDIQEEIPLLPKMTSGRDPVSERSLRHVTRFVRWDRQRRVWRDLRGVAEVCSKGVFSPSLRGSDVEGSLAVRRVHIHEDAVKDSGRSTQPA